jgi:glycine/D-amino acid oxidase-like deaminating enzyme
MNHSYSAASDLNASPPQSPSSSTEWDAVVVGGGFFGCKLALYLQQHLARVLILERDSDLLQGASYNNQARVHNGYHYPRSVLTASRSHLNFPRFIQEYRDCIDRSFAKYYAIGKVFSKVNASQFQLFCRRLELPIKPAATSVKNLFNPNLIEDVFWTEEYAFDAQKLKHKIWQELQVAKVRVKLDVTVKKVCQNDRGKTAVYFTDRQQDYQVKTRYIFNCTYSNINQILKASNLPIVPLKYERAEMALVDVPDSLKATGITIMCGPFFSLMPFPARQLHTLSHVRYTPHYYWQETNELTLEEHDRYSRSPKSTHYPFMIRDAVRYLPCLQDCHYVDSLWAVKTILPQSEIDDSRPILFQKNAQLQHFYSVLGGKIDNIYDIPDELQDVCRSPEVGVPEVGVYECY